MEEPAPARAFQQEATHSMPPKGDVPKTDTADNKEVWSGDFFNVFTNFTGNAQIQHNAALKYLRHECKTVRDFKDGIVLSNDDLQIIGTVHHDATSPGFEIDQADKRQYNWHELVAQLNLSGRELVCNGTEDERLQHGRSCGLVGCEFRPCKWSYDHKTHSAAEKARKPVTELQQEWDFVILRSNGTCCRLHPDWSKSTRKLTQLEPFEEQVEPPPKGLGKQGTPGTFKFYKMVGQEEILRFDPYRKPPQDPAVAEEILERILEENEVIHEPAVAEAQTAESEAQTAKSFVSATEGSNDRTSAFVEATGSSTDRTSAFVSATGGSTDRISACSDRIEFESDNMSERSSDAASSWEWTEADNNH